MLLVFRIAMMDGKARAAEIKQQEWEWNSNNIYENSTI